MTADAPQKIGAIEKVDRAIGYLLDNLDWGRTTLMIGADHCTPVSTGDHTGDGIPVAFYAATGCARTTCAAMASARARRAIWHDLRGDVMTLLTNYTGTQHKFGA